MYEVTSTGFPEEARQVFRYARNTMDLDHVSERVAAITVS